MASSLLLSHAQQPSLGRLQAHILQEIDVNLENHCEGIHNQDNYSEGLCNKNIWSSAGYENFGKNNSKQASIGAVNLNETLADLFSDILEWQEFSGAVEKEAKNAHKTDVILTNNKFEDGKDFAAALNAINAKRRDYQAENESCKWKYPWR